MLSCMKKPLPEDTHLISQLEQIAEGLSKTFSPFCEVVLHDLRDPQHAILAIHNNLSGRQPGDPATELGLARIADPEYPPVIANYQNQFADGRQVKSTSIGIKDVRGQYVAALCMNVDLSLFRGLQGMLEQFGSVSGDTPVSLSTRPAPTPFVRASISSPHAWPPRRARSRPRTGVP